MNSNKATLKRNLLDLIELQHILGKTQVFFEEVSSTATVHEQLQIKGYATKSRVYTCIRVPIF